LAYDFAFLQANYFLDCGLRGEQLRRAFSEESRKLIAELKEEWRANLKDLELVAEHSQEEIPDLGRPFDRVAADLSHLDELLGQAPLGEMEAPNSPIEPAQPAARVAVGKVAGDDGPPTKDQVAAMHRFNRRIKARFAVLDLALATRLRAEEELRRESANAVQDTWPRDTDHLEQVLWPFLSKYAEKVFDAIAEARLKSSGPKFLMRRYLHWLRCTCIPAVVDSVGNGIPLYDNARHILDTIGDVRWPQAADETRRALARLMTEFLGGPHAESLEKRVRAVLNARVAKWEAAAIEKQFTIDPAHPDEVIDRMPEESAKNETVPTPVPPPPPVVCARDIAGARRQLVDTFLARCNEVSTVRIGRRHIWRFIAHSHARQFEYWQAGDDRSPGTTRGATEQDDQNIRRVLSMQPEEFLSQLRQRELISAES
jgi:hypothetical protein